MVVYTYLLKSQKDGSFYVGITKNLINRLNMHNRGYVNATLNKRPFELAFYKMHNGYEEARKHEIWLKKKNVLYKNRLTTIGRGLTPPSQTG